jgi:lipopolysaccharide/colanic/teichoic acid biosynthesis glycosyltransferase
MVLPELLFRDAVVREARRSRRFEEPFVLSRIELTGRGNVESRWTRVLEGLCTARREGDIVGWFVQDTVLGIVRPLTVAEPAESAGSPFVAAQQDLAVTLASEALHGCSVHTDVVSPATVAQWLELLDPGASGRRPGSALRRVAKRTLDIAGSAALMTTLSPVFLAVAAAVKLTSNGPVFFRQERIGRGGTPFMMLKFRTMYANNDPAIHRQYVLQFIESGGAAAPLVSDKPVFKLVDDPRVTPLGNFLRRSSLDELPQFWNVLRGDMSLVGPRPPLHYEVERYRGWHWHRVLDATPGITGLWQVTGRSRTTFDEMVRLDIRYARTHTLWTDIRILLATPKAVVSGNGAH